MSPPVILTCIVNRDLFHTLLCAVKVLAIIERWLQLSRGAQVTRVSHCDFSALEREICVPTNRSYTRRSFRSKQALASEICDIFRSSLRGMLGQLSSRAMHYALPFVRDRSFNQFGAPDVRWR
jgi:hypothetical protein